MRFVLFFFILFLSEYVYSSIQPEPTGQPSQQPSSEPSSQPSSDPSSQPSLQPSSSEPSIYKSSGPKIVDVLIVFPDFSTAVKEDWIEEYTKQQYYKANWALENSGINFRVRVKWAVLNETIGHVFSSAQEVLNSIYDRSDSYFTTIDNIRADYGADFVFVAVDTTYDNLLSDVHLVNDPPTSDVAFSLIPRWDYQYYSVAIGVTKLMGAYEENSQWEGPDQCYRTVLSLYNPGSYCKYAPYFSGPNVYPSGTWSNNGAPIPSGVNNVAYINNRIDTVVDFQISVDSSGLLFNATPPLIPVNSHCKHTIELSGWGLVDMSGTPTVRFIAAELSPFTAQIIEYSRDSLRVDITGLQYIDVALNVSVENPSGLVSSARNIFTFSENFIQSYHFNDSDFLSSNYEIRELIIENNKHGNYLYDNWELVDNSYNNMQAGGVGDRSFLRLKYNHADKLSMLYFDITVKNNHEAVHPSCAPVIKKFSFWYRKYFYTQDRAGLSSPVKIEGYDNHTQQWLLLATFSEETDYYAGYDFELGNIHNYSYGEVEITDKQPGIIRLVHNDTDIDGNPSSTYEIDEITIEAVYNCGPCPGGSGVCTMGHFELSSNADGYVADGEACTACPAGKYQDTVGSTSCKICPAGTSAPYTSMSSCLVCPNGTFASPGATSCRQCAAGKFSGSRARRCQACPIGSISESGQSCYTCEIH